MPLRPDDPILLETLASAGLTHRAAELAPLASHELELERVEHPTGTYFGGDPLLPFDCAWPVYRYRHDEITTWPDFARAEIDQARALGQLVDEPDHVAVPLCWLGVLDFAELAPLDESGKLPREGYLALFFSHHTDVPDAELSARKHATAIYSAAGVPRAPRPHPAQPEVRIAGVVHLAPRVSVTWDPDAWNMFSGSWNERELLSLSQAQTRFSQTHRLLLQPHEESAGPMPPEGHVAFLRVASDMDIGMSFGDEAWITWVLRADELTVARFEDARASLFVG